MGFIGRAAPFCILTATVALTGCRGKDLSFDCDYQSARFEAEAAEEGQLNAEIPMTGPYPVAMVLSEIGIDRLLDGAINSDVPFMGTVSFGAMFLEFEPESEPVIELADYPGCVDCVIFSIQFSVDLEDGAGAVSSGAGEVKLSIPLRLETEPDDSKVTLIAGYDLMKIEELEFTVFGFDSREHKALAGAIRILLEEKIREMYGPTPLMELNSWALGNGSVRLLAREIFVFPEEKTIALGFATNLRLPETAGLDKPLLPEGTPMGLQFHNDVFLALAERMMEEGEIDRRYNDAGDADENGEFGVTLETLVGNESGNNEFDHTFRVWRVAGGYCGFAEVFMRLDVEAGANDIKVSPGPVAVLSGQGSGAVAAEDDELVEENAMVVEKFKNALADQIGLAVNYDALSLEGSDVIIELQEAIVNPDGLFMNMDFFLVASE